MVPICFIMYGVAYIYVYFLKLVIDINFMLVPEPK